MSTVDIEDLVQQTKSYAVSAATNAILTQIGLVFPGLLPWVQWFLEPLLKYYNEKLWDLGELGIFQIAAKDLADVQAAEYRAAIIKLKTLPSDVSKEEWENAETEANKLFFDLVNARR